jgi:hypothetical protein
MVGNVKAGFSSQLGTQQSSNVSVRQPCSSRKA